MSDAAERALRNLLPPHLEWKERGEGTITIEVQKADLRAARAAITPPEPIPGICIHCRQRQTSPLVNPICCPEREMIPLTKELVDLLAELDACEQGGKVRLPYIMFQARCFPGRMAADTSDCLRKAKAIAGAEFEVGAEHASFDYVFRRLTAEEAAKAGIPTKEAQGYTARDVSLAAAASEHFGDDELERPASPREVGFGPMFDRLDQQPQRDRPPPGWTVEGWHIHYDTEEARRARMAEDGLGR